MKPLGYLFLVASLGAVILAPTLAQAGEGRHHRGDRGHVVRPAPPQLSYTAPQHIHNPGYGGHPKRKPHNRGWQHGRHHRPHWKRHRHQVRRHFWKHHRDRGRYYAPPPYWGYRTGGDRYSRDIGSVDFNINYRLFF